MKNKYLISAIIALAIVCSTAVASAFSFGTGTNASTSVQIKSNSTNSEDDDQDDSLNVNSQTSIKGNTSDDRWDDGDRKVSEGMWRPWMASGGITGTVTVVNGSTITVQTASNTTYTVNTSGALIRHTTTGDTTLSSGDRVFIQGVVSGSSVVAAVVIDAGAKSDPKPSDEDKRMGIAGTVTAKSSSNITVLGKNGTTYTVSTVNATFWKNKHETTASSDISVGDTVLVQGTVTGSNVSGAKVYVIKLPQSGSNTNGAITGTVTAKDGDTITLLASNGTSYTVNATEADFRNWNKKSESINEVKIGESISVSGDINGSTINADTVTETHIKKGFFQRFGEFFKKLFGGKRVNGEVNEDSSIKK